MKDCVFVDRSHKTGHALRGARSEVVGNPFEIDGCLFGPPKLHQRPD